ncbi:MAG: hypothetical protein ACLPN1_02680 [Dissulfurispiraceae bacterium]|jgi:hypothetical protein
MKILLNLLIILVMAFAMIPIVVNAQTGPPPPTSVSDIAASD